MGISFCASSIFVLLLLQFCFQYEVVAGDPIVRSNREIINGGGGAGAGARGPSPPPVPPSPPPRPSVSGRIIKAYYVVQAFKKKLDPESDPLGFLKTWDPKNQDICHYKGFFCDIFPGTKEQAVAGVDFNGAGFAGKNGKDLLLSGFIENLTDITVFHANSNNFTGSIPKEIANLTYFYELDLSNNKLSGRFPMEVLGAINLTFLDLRFNSLAGPVPPQVFNLDVDVIFINNNLFVHHLPDNLGSTPALYLTFANNHFIGPIPKSIGTGNTSKILIEVLFLNNGLTGCLPYEIGHLEQVTVFDVSCNRLTGPIPHSFGCLSNIQLLNLDHNQFYGTVPESVCKLPNLAKFNLSTNYFTEVGPECRKLIKKKVLEINNNCIRDPDLPNLPKQRSEDECDHFITKPREHDCPKDPTLAYIPCRKKHYSGSLGTSEISGMLIKYDYPAQGAVGNPNKAVVQCSRVGPYLSCYGAPHNRIRKGEKCAPGTFYNRGC